MAQREGKEIMRGWLVCIAMGFKFIKRDYQDRINPNPDDGTRF